MPGHVFRPFGGGVVATRTGDSVHAAAACFGDEVIIDFPSVAAAVDRIRMAFLADEHPAPRKATLQLTNRDTLEGATRPIIVPVARTCSGCGGRGESWTESCARCAGSGTEWLDHQLQVTVPPGVVDGMRVHFTVSPPHHPPTRIELHIAVG